MRVRSVKELGSLVRERRKDLGWSQQELASRVGVQRLWVSQFEGGKTTAHIGLVMRTLRALDLAISVSAEGEITTSSLPGGTRTIDLSDLVGEHIDEP